MSEFLKLARSWEVVTSSLKVALFVGSVLALINHGDLIFAMSVPRENLLQILLTYLVPYCVSTYSAVNALRSRKRQAVQGQ
jgi:hypothetical protein